MNNMKILIKYILLMFIASTIVGCAQKQETQMVTYNDEYAVELPVYLKKVNDLNKDASLQYMNTVKGLHAMVIDEPKESFLNMIVDENLQENYSQDLDSYSKVLLKRINDNFHIIERPIVEDISINGLNAKYFSFVITITGNDFYYEIAVVEGEKKYYQLYTWVPLNFKSKEMDSMRDIIESFTEL